MNSRQMGKFKIQEDIIRENPELVARAFALIHLVPIRAEMLFAERAIEFVAISDRFREVEQGVMCPEYEIKITDDGNLLVEVIRK